jgi:hypothetical protein
MLDARVIQPSISEWASAPALIHTKGGQDRWCLDYWKLNNATRKDVFPLSLIDECLNTLTGNVRFSKLDANSAFHQIRISPKDRQKTAFFTKYGLLEFVRMGSGEKVLYHAQGAASRGPIYSHVSPLFAREEVYSSDGPP